MTDGRIEEGLSTVIPKLSLPGIGLKDAIEFLANVSELSMFVKWKALGAAGIDQSTPVDVELHDVLVDRALRAVLEDAGGGVTELAYAVDQDVIVISTRDDLSRIFTPRTYDVRDLIVDSETWHAGSPGTSEQAAGDRGETGAELLDVIVGSIDPSSWERSGGPGTIREVSGQLVVTQTSKNHQSIQALLTQLRESGTVGLSTTASTSCGEVPSDLQRAGKVGERGPPHHTPAVYICLVLCAAAIAVGAVFMFMYPWSGSETEFAGYGLRLKSRNTGLVLCLVGVGTAAYVVTKVCAKGKSAS